MDKERLLQALPTRWLARELEWWPEIDSTNRRLKEWMQQGAPTGATVVADMQSAGRGRQAKAWWSPPRSGLYVSFGFYSQSPPDGLLSLLAGVALVEALKAETGLTMGIKWPNDGMLAGKKCAGILVETGRQPQPWAVVGIGVNVRGPVPSAFVNATTLELQRGRPISRSRLFAQLAARLESWVECWRLEGPEPVLAAWRVMNVTLGELVDIVPVAGEPWGGRALDIDPAGALIVEDDIGQMHRVWAGEVSMRYAGGRYFPD